MGEYYDWVNIDKKEYICPCDFNLGNKLHESAFAGNHFLGALYNLLSSDWKGDAIVFLGDQTHIMEKDSNLVLRRLSAEKQTWDEHGYDWDYVAETYRCVSGLFKASEKEVRHEIECFLKYDDFSYNPYRVRKEAPYEGLFMRGSCFFRYTINHSKKEFFDIENTRLTYTNKEGVLITRINPLPLLMAFPGSEYDRCTGLWLGDQIEVSDEKPSSEYKDMSADYGWDY